MKQRDKMRELFQLHRGGEGRVIQAYAEAEERGEVPARAIFTASLHPTTRPDYSRMASGKDGYVSQHERTNKIGRERRERVS